MSDEFSIFSNLPRPRRRRGDPDDDEPRFSARDLLTMNFVPEGPMRPRPSGKGGPSINQTPVVTPSSTWSAADASAEGMSLSNGGMTATPVGSSWQTIRNTISKTSGLLYMEFLATTGGNQYIEIGLASVGMVVGGGVDLGVNNYSCCVRLDNGSIQVTTGFATVVGSAGAYTPVTNDVLAMAVNFTTGSVWFARNNVWVASGNPAAGLNPAVTFTLATTGALCAAGSFTSGVWTLQPTAASQKYAPPSGFTPWG